MQGPIHHALFKYYAIIMSGIVLCLTTCDVSGCGDLHCSGHSHADNCGVSWDLLNTGHYAIAVGLTAHTHTAFLRDCNFVQEQWEGLSCSSRSSDLLGRAVLRPRNSTLLRNILPPTSPLYAEYGCNMFFLNCNLKKYEASCFRRD
jgi:hypothetical protein